MISAEAKGEAWKGGVQTGVTGASLTDDHI